jgi:histidine phosphotransferase ChpT
MFYQHSGFKKRVEFMHLTYPEQGATKADMPYHSETLAALIGSRICHDLISPIGAVSNGLELMALAGAADGPEMALVCHSAASANARIRLLRLAFGIASADQVTRADEIVTSWAGVHGEGRVTLHWNAPASLNRPIARLIVLALLCAETALPRGGRITVENEGSSWCLEAHGVTVVVEPALWDCITSLRAAQNLRPAHVQFLLLPHHLIEEGRGCNVSHTATDLRMSF